jgi:phosphotriesterase-related protein
MAIIRTVCGDIRPDQLGPTYLHEHLLTAPPAFVPNPDYTMDSEPIAIRELQRFRDAGGRAIIEMTTRDYGRNPDGLRRVAQQADVHVLAITGWQKHKISQPWLAERSINELADQMIAEIEQGIDGSTVRAGLIKASSSLDRITAEEEKAFRAAARAHHETGALISTHTEAGSMALEQVALLRSEGVDPARMLIGHLDRKMDYAYHLAVLQTGVTIGYDQIGKEKYAPDAMRIEFLLRLIEAGYTQQIALSGDMARRSSWPGYGNWGGPGLTHILWRFIPWLHERGLPPAIINQILVENPARLLAIAT